MLSRTQYYVALGSGARFPYLDPAMAPTNSTSIERLRRDGAIQIIPSAKLELVQLRDFLTLDHCDRLITLIDADRRPSTLADANGDAGFRTSETCDLPSHEPAVAELEAKLNALTGIDPVFGEPVQGQRYAVGQEFKAHCDWFNPDGEDFDRYCRIAGQRSWTFMIYLNAVEAGGATRFKAIGKSFQPETGKLLGWNNMRPDGRPNPDTLHHGIKVRRGAKYIITKWYRERAWG